MFADTIIGVQTATAPLVLKNAGDSSLGDREALTWTFEGPDEGDFVDATHRGTTLSGDDGSCGYQHMAPDQFGAGASCGFALAFHPTLPGVKQATVRLKQTGERFVIRATAIAAPATLVATTPSLFVGPLQTVSPPSFELINKGSTSVDLGTPVVTGPFELATPAAWGCPAQLASGGSCSVGALRSTSQMPGCATGTFTTTTAAISIPLSASL